MQVGAINQTITVENAAEVLETDSSEHGQVITTQQIVELPLNGRNMRIWLCCRRMSIARRYRCFSLLTGHREKGRSVRTACAALTTISCWMVWTITPTRRATKGFRTRWRSHRLMRWAEFQVVTNNYAAEYGRVGGAVVNAVMKSGTNQYHGTAYDFLRNTDLNAVGFTFSPAVFQKPTLQRNQFGVTVLRKLPRTAALPEFRYAS